MKTIKAPDKIQGNWWAEVTLTHIITHINVQSCKNNKFLITNWQLKNTNILTSNYDYFITGVSKHLQYKLFLVVVEPLLMYSRYLIHCLCKPMMSIECQHTHAFNHLFTDEIKWTDMVCFYIPAVNCQHDGWESN
jgi:hypothetical protein